MSHRTLLLLLVLGGCTTRAAPAADGAAQDDALPADGWIAPDRSVARDGAGACTTLTRVAQVTLEYADTMKTTPALAFDGERFALVWHSQPAPVSSFNGELRFALIDRGGKPSDPSGVSLGGDNGALEPALVAASTYAVVHLPTGAAGGAVLRQLDAAGKTLGTAPISGQVSLAALAPHAQGFAVLTAPQGGIPRVTLMDSSGSVLASTDFLTAQVMASLWLAQRPGGYAAVLHSTNKNAELHLLDAKLDLVSTAYVGGTVVSPSFTVLPDGFAALYLSGAVVELKRLDAAGKETGEQVLGTASTGGASDPTALTALAWTGERLVAAYPSKVPGKLVARVLDQSGRPVGDAVQLAGCLAVSSAVRMVRGKDLLAVATLDQASGVAKNAVCLTVLRCD